MRLSIADDAALRCGAAQRASGLELDVGVRVVSVYPVANRVDVGVASAAAEGTRWNGLLTNAEAEVGGRPLGDVQLDWVAGARIGIEPGYRVDVMDPGRQHRVVEAQHALLPGFPGNRCVSPGLQLRHVSAATLRHNWPAFGAEPGRDAHIGDGTFVRTGLQLCPQCADIRLPVSLECRVEVVRNKTVLDRVHKDRDTRLFPARQHGPRGARAAYFGGEPDGDCHALAGV